MFDIHTPNTLFGTKLQSYDSILAVQILIGYIQAKLWIEITENIKIKIKPNNGNIFFMDLSRPNAKSNKNNSLHNNVPR